jgi:hypothetical protein
MARGMRYSATPGEDQDRDLYDATPEPTNRRRAAATANTASSSASPGISFSSDKENTARDNGRNKGKERAVLSQAHDVEPAEEVDRSGKRKRTDREAVAAPPDRRRRTTERAHTGLAEFDASYDPEQDPAERRRIRTELRDLNRDLNDHRSEYLHPESKGLIETLNKANQIAGSVKQTADATIDSRLLVTTADLSYKKTVQLTLGESVTGVDVDEFVSKCISFMRRGENLIGATQNAGGDEGDMLNWEYLGRHSCLQHNARPAVPGFLLGPLSVEKRTRKPIERKAKLNHSQLKETQPVELTEQDLEKKDKNLTELCTGILAGLKKVQHEKQAAADEESWDDMTQEEMNALMAKHDVNSSGAVDYWKFVVNPLSFGQTIENMFYVSFLVRDGKAGITIDDSGLPFVGMYWT